MRSLTASVVACGLLLALGPGVAAATPTTLVYDGTPQEGARISVTAAPREANRILVKDYRVEKGRSEGAGLGDVYMKIQDAAGVTASSPYCTQLSSTEVGCETIGLDGLSVRTGDGPDTVVINNRGLGDRGRRPRADHLEAPMIAAVGSGDDVAWMKSGFGVIRGGTDDDKIAGGVHSQRLFGDSGDDLVGNAGGGKDLCDGGDGDDRGQIGCEVIRSLEGEPFFFDLGAELAKHR